MKTKPVVFFSHSGDSEFLRILTSYLSDCESIISDWRDQSGQAVASKVREDISASDLVVLILSEKAMASPWVHQEIGYALGLGKRLLPVRSIPVSNSALPALLEGRQWEPYDPDRLEESALRTAVRIGKILQEDLYRFFTTHWDYQEWWITVDERDYTEEKCYWATPHDIWSWLMSHIDQMLREVRYRTLIRGDLEFDRKTLKIYDAASQEVVIGVQELSAIEEVAVIGNLSVETLWDPDFMAEVDQFLQTTPEGQEVIAWYKRISHKPTRIEVRLSLDPGRAASHRRRLDNLYHRYERTPPHQDPAADG